MIYGSQKPYPKLLESVQATVIFLEKKYSLNGLSQARGVLKKKLQENIFFNQILEILLLFRKNLIVLAYIFLL